MITEPYTRLNGKSHTKTVNHHFHVETKSGELWIGRLIMGCSSGLFNRFLIHFKCKHPIIPADAKNISMSKIFVDCSLKNQYLELNLRENHHMWYEGSTFMGMNYSTKTTYRGENLNSVPSRNGKGA